jgi:transcriptional regulator with XRE-family HTH domain
VILGTNLREARQRARLSQVELAQRATLAQQVISLIEAGRANPTVQTLQRLADALGYPLADLLKTG